MVTISMSWRSTKAATNAKLTQAQRTGGILRRKIMKIIDEFVNIDSDDALYAFLRKYTLTKGTRPTSSQVFGVYAGQYEDAAVTVTHRWYDPSGPFQNEPDIHKAKLELEGFGSREVAYNG
jgi:hypothetical protein